ncbi:hypothetical protein G9C85_17300 [Halorubellus sp. JP-L1]|uniref:hypothetical protein n=1 Tax=Halorubellus sp. JP-L1 TaxID=2715753 RepID=UPI0014077B2D|nr:hypothetical protein [Halorubellus sp. JP-L1]NHN43376.1 hypothetical protein [Halorubellus sp. JP-L1]
MVFSRGFVLLLAVTFVLAAAVGGLLTVEGSFAAFVANVGPLALAAFVGVVAILLGAAVANALAGSGGPQGPDGPTGADRREESNEWQDPPGVDDTDSGDNSGRDGDAE